jgi:tetratricopeptide (TPR) repeat protein
MVVRWFLFAFHFVIGTLSSFLRKWFLSRRWAALLWGLPAVVVAVALMIVAERARSVTRAELVVHYQSSAVKAEQNGNEPAAALWLKKTVMLEPEAPQHQFRLAVESARRGRLDQAREVLRRIAPPDEQGYPEAHFWIARDMVASQRALTPKFATTLEHHLTAAMRSEQVAGQAHANLGELFLQQRKIDEAIEQFEAAAEQLPEVRMRLGQLYTMQGEAAKAKSQLQRAVRHFRERAEESREDIRAQLTWAECEMLLDNPGEAERVLRQARAETDDPRYSQALVGLFLLQFDRLRREQPEDLESALTLLEGAAALGPGDPRLLPRMAQFVQSDAAARQKLRQSLKRVIAAGKPTATAHLALGALAAEEGDLETAGTHFELGLELRPDMLALMNNLAWTLAHAEPPDLDRALQLIEPVYAKAPDSAEVLETRGQILAKLGRWKECIANLEKARPSMPERYRVHETLALAYESIGDEELADMHRQLAEKLNPSQGE